MEIRRKFNLIISNAKTEKSHKGSSLAKQCPLKGRKGRGFVASDRTYIINATQWRNDLHDFHANNTCNVRITSSSDVNVTEVNRFERISLQKNTKFFWQCLCKHRKEKEGKVNWYACSYSHRSRLNWGKTS